MRSETVDWALTTMRVFTIVVVTIRGLHMFMISSTSIRINLLFNDQAKVDATIEYRSIAGQIEFWAGVGRAALDNPDLPVTFVAKSLASMASPAGLHARRRCQIDIPQSCGPP